MEFLFFQMNRVFFSNVVIILLIMTGCVGGNQSTDALITVDVMEKYPKKELALQDFLDVEYIPLETTDEFVCQGEVLAVGKSIIIVKNQINDGNIYIFDRNGKGLRIINHRGRGGEEYLYINGFTLDEDNNEILVDDVGKILVYDLYGKFIRSFQKWWEWGRIYNYDREHWICKVASPNTGNDKVNNQQFTIVFKNNGSIVRDFRINFKQKIETSMRLVRGEAIYGSSVGYFPIIPYNDSWILTEPSSDTIYRLSTNYDLIPFMARIPSIQTMTPEVFLFPSIFTERYYFMETVKKEGDLEKRIGLFPKTHLVYDKQERAIYEYTVHNDDFSTKSLVDMSQKAINKEIAFWQKLEAYQLVEAYERGQLKGKLKEIAMGLEEESNPVIMLAKLKTKSYE